MTRRAMVGVGKKESMEKNKEQQQGVVYLDLFSGIGGFALGLHKSGIKIIKHYYSEIDKFCIYNYNYNFKEATNVGNISDFRGEGIERPNIITFGFPCQDLSIAGKQEGLFGTRSSLFFQALRLIEKFKPEVFIFENVKGLLSSNEGKDFEVVLRSIADLGLYECQWQLVNTAWILPQNRERVYFVGYLAGRGSPTVFPISESDFKNTGISGQRVNAITTRTGAAEAGGTYIVEGKQSSQIHTYGDTGTGGQRGRVVSDSGINPALSATQYKDPPKIKQVNKPKHSNDRVYEDTGLSSALNTAQGGDRQPFVVQPILTPEREQKRQNGRRMKEDGEPSFTLTGQDKHGIVIRGNLKGEDGHECHNIYDKEGIAPIVRQNYGKITKVALRWARSEKGKQSRKEARNEQGKDYTPFSEGNRTLQLSDDNISGCITGAYNKDSLLVDRLSDYQGDKVTQTSSIHPTIPATGGNRLRGIGIQDEDMAVRKLTEVECERLQGFDDDWTKWGIKDGKKIEISSSQRYKQTGNAVTVDIVKMIGSRIERDNILNL